MQRNHPNSASMGKEGDLLNAIHSKNSAQVHKLLIKYCPKGKTKKLNLNHQDIDGLTVLHHAVFSAQHTVVQMLLEHCAPSVLNNASSISSSSGNSATASHRSASVSMTSCLGGAHLSSSMGSSSVSSNSTYLHPDLADTRGRRPFHFACASHSPNTVDTAERLLASGCSSSMADCEGNTPLHVVCANMVHGAALARLLLRAPLDCIVYNHHGLTPLDIACDVGNVRVVEYLTAIESVRRFIQSMSHTAPRKGHHLTSCLHMAAANGHLEVLRIIFTRVPFVNINHTTLQGTCLHVAALASQWNVLLYLLQCGVDPNALNAREQLASDLVNVSHPGGREVKHLLQELCSATQVQAVKEYKGNGGPTTLDPRTHITFRERELITVLNRCPDGMWKGFVSSQGLLHTGYFPASHVAPITNSVPYSQSQSVPPCFSRPCVSNNQLSNATPATKPPNLPLLVSHQPPSHSAIPSINTATDWWSSGHPHQLIAPGLSLNPAVSQCQSSPDSAVVDCSSPCVCGGGGANPTAVTSVSSCGLQGCNNTIDNNIPGLMSILPTYACYCDVSGTPHGSSSSGCGSNRNSSSADSVDSGRGSVHTLHHLLLSMSSGPQQQSSGYCNMSAGNQEIPSTPASSQIGRANISQPPVNITSPASATPVLMHQKSAPPCVGSTSSHSGSCTSLGRSSLGSGDDVPFPCHSALFVSRESALTFTPQQQEQQLCQLLNELQLDVYIPCFQLAGYAEDLNIVSRMTPEDLTAIGVTHPRHRKLIKNAVTMMQWPDTLPNEWPGSVDEWLQLLKLSQYSSLLQEQKVSTLEHLSHITWEDLEEIGVTKLGHQKKLLLAIERLKRVTSAAIAAASSGALYPQFSSCKSNEACANVPSDVINQQYLMSSNHHQESTMLDSCQSSCSTMSQSQSNMPPAPPRRTSSGSIRSPKSLPRTPKDPELSMASRYLSPARRRRSGAYENLSDRDLGIVPLPPLPVSMIDVCPPNIDAGMTSSMEEYCSSGSQHSGSSCSVHTSMDSPNSTYYRLPFANENCGTIRLNFATTGRGSVPPGGPGSVNPSVGTLSECSSPKHRSHTAGIGLPPQMPQLPYDTSAYRRASLDRNAHPSSSTNTGKAGVLKNTTDNVRTPAEGAPTMTQFHNNLISKAAARVRLPNFEDDSSSTSGEMDGIRDALEDLQGSLERSSLGPSHPGANKKHFSHFQN